MTDDKLTTADVLRAHWAEHLARYSDKLSGQQIKAARDIMACRTAQMGGHCEHRRCDCCGHETQAYNSCGNRACPRCGALAKEKWLAQRRKELLPVQYFHLVFTLPKAIEDLALVNRRVVYDMLFKAAAKTLRTIAEDPSHLGARIGFMSVLHTWGSALLHHPHVHVIAPGGGISPDGKHWVNCRKNFFLPVLVLSRLFRRLLLEGLDKAYKADKLRFSGKLASLSGRKAFEAFLKRHRRMKWVVFAKPPFGGAKTTLDYLARYTHRSAISDSRLIGMSEGKVSFRYKDYKKEGESRVMTLQADEFIRRFLMHVPPKGFMRIRHYGLFGNRYRSANIALCRQLLDVSAPEPIADLENMAWDERYLALTGHDPLLCPVCKKGRLELVADEYASPQPREQAGHALGPPKAVCELPSA